METLRKDFFPCGFSKGNVVPWRKDRIVQEILKDFSVGGVSSFSLQDFWGFGAEAARAFICPLGIGFGGFRLLFLVSDASGSDPHRDLQLWRRKRRRRRSEEQQLDH